ncbi:TPA: DUF1380 family protein [Salmonella enterica subsp. enterica serovar Derby]
MYGTCEELCEELARMFTPDEQLALLLWTEGGTEAACNGLKPTDEEIRAVMAAIGRIPMDEYRLYGVTLDTARGLLQQHREEATRKVNVPGSVLARLLNRLDRDLIAQESEAWDAGHAVPDSIRRAREDIVILRQHMAAGGAL